MTSKYPLCAVGISYNSRRASVQKLPKPCPKRGCCLIAGNTAAQTSVRPVKVLSLPRDELKTATFDPPRNGAKAPKPITKTTKASTPTWGSVNFNLRKRRKTSKIVTPTTRVAFDVEEFAPKSRYTAIMMTEMSAHIHTCEKAQPTETIRMYGYG